MKTINQAKAQARNSGYKSGYIIFSFLDISGTRRFGWSTVSSPLSRYITGNEPLGFWGFYKSYPEAKIEGVY